MKTSNKLMIHSWLRFVFINQYVSVWVVYIILDISNNFQTREIIHFNQGKGAVQQLPWSHATSSHQTTTFSFGCKRPLAAEMTNCMFFVKEEMAH